LHAKAPAPHDKAPALHAKAPARRCGGHGEPLVLLHPFGLCSDVWAPVLPALRKHHEVFAIAIPGHAGSEPLPPNFGHTIAEGVDVLERKLDSLGIKSAHIVGSSLGGWLAIELARRGRALSVVALAPGGGWEMGSAQQRRVHRRFRLTRALLKLGGALALHLVHFEPARHCFLRDAVARPRGLKPEEARLLIETLWRCEAYDDIVRALPKEPPALPFRTLPCPVRLVWGSHDRLLPMNGYSERWRRVLPGAEWVVLDDTGHLPMYDDPGAVAEAIIDLTTREIAADKLTG
jgi:pimeloyl-ACP methyl ester carboxylesterase